MFISDHRCPDTVEIMFGLPHAVLLESTHGDLAVLVSAAAKPSRPPSEMFPGNLLAAVVAASVRVLGSIGFNLNPKSSTVQP